MKNPLSPDSALSKNGGNIGTVLWLAGNIVVGGDDKMLRDVFLMANANGWIGGQTPTGTIHQYTMALGGYGLIIADAVVNPGHAFNLLTGVGGALACGQGIASAFKERDKQKDIIAQLDAQKAFEQKINKPLYQKILKGTGSAVEMVLSLPGRALIAGADIYNRKAPKPVKQTIGFVGSVLSEVIDMPGDIITYTPRLLRQKRLDDAARYQDNMNDITQRPLFNTAVFGIVCDAAYLITGLKTDNDPMTAAGILWMAGWVPVGVSLPKEGQKNLIQQVGDLTYKKFFKKAPQPQ